MDVERSRFFAPGWIWSVWLACACRAGAGAAQLPDSILLSPTSSRDVAYAAQQAPKGLGEKLRRTYAEVAAVVRRLKGRRKETDRWLALAELRLEKACLLLTRYRAGDYRDAAVRKELEKAGGIAAELNAGRKPKRPASGLIEAAYYSPIDGSPQPFVYYLPKRKPGPAGYGLFVFLHGYVSYLDKVNWIEFMYSDKLNDLAENLGLIPMLPFGRSNTEFMGVGEVDVLDAISEMKARLPIDGSRVFLSGGSMGGSGAYTIACHYPHLFAGVAPIAGRYSYYVWKDIDRSSYIGFKRIQTDMDYAQAIAQNLFNVPAFIFHGSGDYLVKPAQSRGMAKLLRKLGQPVQYKEFKEGDHWIWDLCFQWPDFVEWLKTRRAPKWPRRIKFKTYTLDYDRAYWARILRFKQWGRPAWIDVQAKPGGRVEVSTHNVAGLALRLGPALMAGAARATVVVDGRKRVYPIPADGEVSIGLAPRPSGLLKRRGLCGPVREAYCGPFLMVYGTQGDVSDARAALLAGRDWIRFAKGRALLKADRAVSEEDIARNNLILFGDAQSNSLVKRIADALPIRIGPKAFEVGRRRIARPAASLLMIYPNPLNPRRYVVLNVGTVWGRHQAINHKLDHVPDFIVFRDKAAPDGNNEFICAGYFDPQWRLRDDLIWDEGQGNVGRVPLE